MRIAPSLLRVLLAVSLVLNGLSLPMPAHALGMQQSQLSNAHPGAHEPAQHKPSREPFCHGEAAAPGVNAAAVISAAAPPCHQPDQGSIDCCDSGSCDNVCMQSACAVLTGKVLDAGPLPLAPGARAIPAGTPTPALPHPIRPPIG